jgi:hypothetical protein
MFELYTLLIFILSCYGGANGIVYSRLLLPMRLWITYSFYKLDEKGNFMSGVQRTNPIAKFFSKLVYCPMCMGFWLGIFFNLFIFSPIGLSYGFIHSMPAFYNKLAILLFDGFLGSASAWIMHLLLRYRMEGA